MMKTRVLPFLALLLLCGFAQGKSPSLSITFGNVQTGKAYLYSTQDLTTDTITFWNGKLAYHKALASPGVFHLVVEGYNDWNRPFKLVLSSDPTALNFSSFTPAKETDSLADLYPNRPAFKSDPNQNAAYYDFLQNWMTFFDSIQRLTPEEGEADVHLEERKNLYVNYLKACQAAVAQNSDKLVAAVMVEHLLNNNLLPLEVTQSMYASLSQHVKDNPYAESISAEAQLKPGSAAPAFAFKDLNGKAFSLQEAKGKKVLLHFWSSTCAPCIKEAPRLLELQAKYKDQGLLIINVSLDTDRARWLKGISRAGIGEMINMCDFKGFGSAIVQDYRIRAIPAHYLIDENGSILLKGSIEEIARRL